MQSIEVTAKTVEEATKLAAEKLGVDVSQLEVKPLEEIKGLFGKTTVRIKADVIASKPEATPAPAEPAAATAEPEPAPAKEASKPEKSKGRTRGKEKPAAKKEETQEVAAEATPEATEPEEVEVVATQEDAEKLAQLVRDLVASADLEVTVKPSGVSGRYVNLQLDGKDVAYLVGKHGEVLNALQYLVNIVGNRKIANGVRATLDGNDYRKRREDTLTKLATDIAEQVKKRGEEAVLDALPAFERRIVHKALGVIDGIVTYSEGEEPNRRVVIAPAE